MPDEAVPGLADFRDVLPSDGVVGDRLYVACATSAVVDRIGEGTSVELRAQVDSGEAGSSASLPSGKVGGRAIGVVGPI